jgi:Family of unknown function (DUF6941)
MAEFVDAPDFFGYTVFCDDIRFEVNGKFTYVGVYSGRMSVNASFPATLPKFGIAVTFYQLKEKFVPHLGLRVFLPGDSGEEASIQGDFGETSEGAIRQQIESQPRIPETKYITMNAGLVLSPLIIKEPGSITVRVLRDDKLYRVGHLSILQGEIIDNPTSSSPPA